MKSAKSNGRNLDARFPQRAVGHLSVTALPTSPGNLGGHRDSRQATDKFASLDIFRHHFLPSFVVHNFMSGVLSKIASLLRFCWTNFVALKVEEVWRPAHRVFTSWALSLGGIALRFSNLFEP